MTNGMQITTQADLKFANTKDFVINTRASLGGLKVLKVLTFKFGGVDTLMSNFFGNTNYIQKYEHGLGYVPGYLPYLIDHATLTISTPDNDAIHVGGTDFINVDLKKIIVGFDTATTNPRTMKVILFAEKISSD